MFSIQKWDLKKQILILPSIVLLFVAAMGAFNYLLIKQLFEKEVYPTFSNTLLTEEEAKLEELVSIQADLIAIELQGKSPKEYNSVIEKMTDPVRFFDDNSGYFFTYAYDGTRINQPTDKSQNGKNFIDLKDPNGVRLIDGLIQQAKKGGGIVEYHFEKPGAGLQPKISYAKTIPGTEIMIGTGTYIDNIEALRADLEGNLRLKLHKNTLLINSIYGGMIISIFVIGLIIAQRIAKPLTRTIGELSGTSSEVTSAASQVNDASQHLANGSSSQAAAIEETSASLEELSSMTEANAGHTSKAAALMEKSRQSTLRVQESIEEMSRSIREIKEASDETVKINKTIDEIAFQTNILALNAAVEAARAGEAGAGFAVVAEEVRALAQRSAEAARNTSELLSQAQTKAEHGSQTTERVNGSIQENVVLTQEVSHIINEINMASQQQAEGIRQVTIAVSQMEQVTQQNAASAEETASASQQLSSQAEGLDDIVLELRQIVYGQSNVVSNQHSAKVKASTTKVFSNKEPENFSGFLS